MLANLAGDYDSSAAVDGGDFLSWQRGLGTAYTATDLQIWSVNYGAVAAVTTISLEGSTIAVSGSGATANGSVVTITQGGTYSISGTLADGQIVVDAGDNDVNLILNGVTLNNSDGPAIYVANADDTTITLADGTQNTIGDGAAYASTGTDDPDAAIFSHDDLVIDGNGSLTVIGRYKHGIVSKDDLTIEGGVIAVTSVKDGIRGRDSVVVSGGDHAQRRRRWYQGDQ